MFHFMIRLVKFSVRVSFVSCFTSWCLAKFSVLTSLVSCFISWFVCKNFNRIVICFRIGLIGTFLYVRVVTEGSWGTAWDGSYSTSVVLYLKAMAWLAFSLQCNHFPLRMSISCNFYYLQYTISLPINNFHCDLATAVTGPKLFIERKRKEAKVSGNLHSPAFHRRNQKLRCNSRC